MAYPATLDSFTNPSGTSLVTSPDHAGLHTDINTTVTAVETVLGTNSGTSVLKNFVAGDFPARINSSNVLQTAIQGTINNSTLGTPAITGGTLTNTTISGAINNATIGTPAITGGTATSTVLNSNTIGTPAITGGTARMNVSPPQGWLSNGYITTSVSSNNLTVAVKTLAAADPSATDPVYVRIGNTVRTITSALSVTLNAGTNYFNSGAAGLATYEVDYFVYLAYKASDQTIVLGFSRHCSGRVYGDLSSTNTNDKHIAVSASLASTDEMEVVGRFNAVLSATANFYWSIPATSIIVNRPIFETRWLSWVPTYTGFSSAPSGVQSYKLTGDLLSFMLGGTGTSNSATFNLTLPLTALDQNLATFSLNQLCGVYDNNAWATTVGVLGIAPGGAASITVKAGLNFSTAAANAYGGFTTSNGKGIFGEFFCKV